MNKEVYKMTPNQAKAWDRVYKQPGCKQPNQNDFNTVDHLIDKANGRIICYPSGVRTLEFQGV